MVAEHEWTSVSGIFFPCGKRKQQWDSLILALIIYSCLVVPFRICFSSEAEGSILYFELGVTLTFLADVVFNFNTAYIDDTDGQWIIYRPAIAAMYLRGWFWIDFPSSIPME